LRKYFGLLHDGVFYFHGIPIMAMKKLTLEILAKMAGVGVATVDRVLNERGGVSPETARKVLEAARKANLRRVLPEAYQRPWQIELLLSGNDAFFFKKLARDFSEVADAVGYQRVCLHRTLIPESQPERLARHLIDCIESRDGIIVFAHDYGPVRDALALCQARGVPVVTIATDLPDAGRLCHVGIDQYQAGRTAGLLMSRATPQAGEAIVVSGRFDYRAHRQRVAGFRDALQQRAPQLRLREVLAGQDQRKTIRKLLEQSLNRTGNIVGLYNTGLGNTEISEILARHQLSGRCTYITHELYSVTRRLLQQDILSFTLDQNAAQHAQLALGILLRHLDTGWQPDVYEAGKVAFNLITAENLT
jgi:LacI family transcriptional regulator